MEVSIQDQPLETIREQPKAEKTSRSIELESPTQRALEASLFIDKKFFDVSVIVGNSTPPEHLFGEKPWQGYIDARNFSRQFGQGNLTIDFITGLHSKIASPVDSQIAGKIRNVPIRGGDYNNPKEPVTYTDEEIESIKQNPYLMFQEAGGKNTGFIHYPFSKEGEDPQAHIQNLLQEVCDWYNGEKAKPGTDPYKLAALLQRKMISIHPFYDANGTTSRVLMNWALETNGVAPSALDNPSNDVLTDENSWVDAVKKGGSKYTESQKRNHALESAGIEDVAYALGLSPERAFYDYIFRHIGKPPAFFSKNNMQDHQTFEEFFTQFIEELKKFQKFLQTETKIGDKTITQGGLISEGFMKLLSKSGFLSEETTDQFFTNVTLFRGGSLEIAQIDDLTICQMMGNYTGVGTGYRALRRSYMSALSGDVASRQQITESAAYYNKMMAKYYLHRQHPQISPYGADVKDLEQTIRDHVAANTQIWESPFASTSFSRSVSLGFTGGLAKFGALFTVRAPKEGIVLSFPPRVMRME